MIKIIYEGGGETLTCQTWQEAERIGKGCAEFIFSCKRPTLKIFAFCIIDFDAQKSTIYEYEKPGKQLLCTIY